MEKNDNITVRAEDLMRRCQRQYTPQFTSFLTPEEQCIVAKLAKSFPDLFVIFAGGMKDAERRVACMFPSDIYTYPEDDGQLKELEALAETEAVEISGSGFVNINHRDVLGSVMALGIKREAVGDILVDGELKKAYVALVPGMADYICTNLERVARDKVRVKRICFSEMPEKKQRFSDMSLTLASLRLDALVSGMVGVSRDKAKLYISSGRVFLNHAETKSCDKEFGEGDTVTVKGEGKFIVDALLGQTAKNRYRVVVRKYL